MKPVKKPRYISVSETLMSNRFIVAEQNVKSGHTGDSYIKEYGGPRCSVGLEYLPRYARGIKLNAWITEILSI
jgi:hypothetical protein